MTTESQSARILQHLKAGGKITPIEALDEYGCFRLGARIFDLKERGHPIQKRMVEVSEGKRVAEYWMDA